MRAVIAPSTERGSASGSPPSLQLRHELAHEQRVAPRALSELGQPLRRQRRLGGGPGQHLGDHRVAEGAQLDALDERSPPTGSGLSGVRLMTISHHREPASAASRAIRSREASSIRWTSLKMRDPRARQDEAEELAGHLLELLLALRGIGLVHLARARDLDSGDDRDQRQPRRQVGGLAPRRPASAEPRAPPAERSAESPTARGADARTAHMVALRRRRRRPSAARRRRRSPRARSAASTCPCRAPRPPPRPARAPSAAARAALSNVASSSSRPMNGALSNPLACRRRPRRCSPRGRAPACPWRRRAVAPSSRSCRWSAATSSRVASSSPGAACCAKRAARFTQSPISEYVRR